MRPALRSTESCCSGFDWRARQVLERAIAAYDLPIEGRDEWLAAAVRRLA